MLGENVAVVTLMLESKAQLQEIDVEILCKLLRRQDVAATETVNEGATGQEARAGGPGQGAKQHQQHAPWVCVSPAG